MAKKAKIKRNVMLAVFAVVLVSVVSVFLLNLFDLELTGRVVTCTPGNVLYSVHVEGNKDGYIADVNDARVNLRSKTTNCIYEGLTNSNGNVNFKVNPGTYKVSVYKAGKCNAHSEYVTVTTSSLLNIRLKNCARNFWV